MITCVKKLSITGVRVLSFLVNSFEKLFLSQDTFFKITILIFHWYYPIYYLKYDYLMP